jgi:methyl-accepting chemotaxis protein
MLNKLRIRTKLMVLVGGFCLVMLGLGAVASRTVDDVRIGGNAYTDIVMHKDLIADILPPPMYILESFLNVELLMKGPEDKSFDKNVAKLVELKAAYDDRFKYWTANLKDGEIKVELLRGAHEPAMRFFASIEAELIPALRRGDRPAALKALETVSAAYELHREAIDRVVAATNKEFAAVELQSNELVRSRIVTLIQLGVASLLMLITAGWVISRSILKPIDETLQLIKEVAEGNGDLTRRLSATGSDELAMLASSFNSFMDTLHDIMADVKRSASSVSSAAQRVSTSAEHISSGAQEQASSLEETAASLEEITSTVKQNSDNAQQAAQLAHGSRGVAEQGGMVVSRAVTAMAEINRASKKIAEIITTIDEIAFQTNVLALNAAVEAARAGEQGRGFAVVATEVGNLSQRSAAAAKEIKALINDAVRLVDDGAGLVNQSGNTLTEIVVSVKRVTDIVGEIAAASREQTAGVEQVNTAVTQMDSVTQTNAAETEALASTASGLSRRASEMLMLVNRFKVHEHSSHSNRDSGDHVEHSQVRTRPRASQGRKAKPAYARPAPQRAEYEDSDDGVSAMDRAMSGAGTGASADGFEEV